MELAEVQPGLGWLQQVGVVKDEVITARFRIGSGITGVGNVRRAGRFFVICLRVIPETKPNCRNPRERGQQSQLASRDANSELSKLDLRVKRRDP